MADKLTFGNPEEVALWVEVFKGRLEKADSGLAADFADNAVMAYRARDPKAVDAEVTRLTAENERLRKDLEASKNDRAHLICDLSKADGELAATETALGVWGKAGEKLSVKVALLREAYRQTEGLQRKTEAQLDAARQRIAELEHRIQTPPPPSGNM